MTKPIGGQGHPQRWWVNAGCLGSCGTFIFSAHICGAMNAVVKALKALGSPRQRLSMVSCEKSTMGRTLCECGEDQGTA
jgi:hypothetical protein